MLTGQATAQQKCIKIGGLHSTDRKKILLNHTAIAVLDVAQAGEEIDFLYNLNIR